MKDLSNENVVHIKNEKCEYLQFRKLLEYTDIINHAYGLKPANYNLGENGDNSVTISMYKELCDCVNADYNKLIRPNQTHTNNVNTVKCAENNILLEPEKYKDVDGLVTNLHKVVLASTNADCILLLYFDPVKKVIGNVHSGWKGTFQKIAINGVKKMVEEFGSNPKDIICCICPSIRKCHFEVEKDVKEMCESIFKYTNRINDFIEYVGKKDGKDKWKIDTVLINKILLQEAGLIEENIIDSGICSVCNSDKVHSYRIEGKGFGRSSAIIELV